MWVFRVHCRPKEVLYRQARCANFNHATHIHSDIHISVNNSQLPFGDENQARAPILSAHGPVRVATMPAQPHSHMVTFLDWSSGVKKTLFPFPFLENNMRWINTCHFGVISINSNFPPNSRRDQIRRQPWCWT